MAYRSQRLAALVQRIVGDAIVNRLSDPRISRLTSVTRVEVSPDQLRATAFVSVIGTEAEARTTMAGLESARGTVQTRLARQLDIRQCPELQFSLDRGFKVGLQTLSELDRVRADAPATDRSGANENAAPQGADEAPEADDPGAAQ